ncbi:MAG: hypothetical protein ACJAZO_004710 [Myxococcota bacterium]|jgi:hypothetical protein
MTLPTPLHADFATARNDAHYAAQLIAAAGVALLKPDPHFHYSSATFAGTQLVGEALPDGRQVRLDIPTLTVSVGDQDLALRGQTMAKAMDWLAQQLGHELTYAEWDMPKGPSGEYGPFTASDEALAQLAEWYVLATHALAALAPSVGTADSARIWPHHFDIARLYVLHADEDPEKSRTVGTGMTPGDGGIAQPYFYATPWPYPSPQPTPKLPVGRWNTEGWYGAVLEAGQMTSESQVDTFFRHAFEHLTQTLERESY